MSYIAPAQVADYIGDKGKSGVKAIAHDFYYTLMDMLNNYGDQDADMVLPNGNTISKDQKYEYYGTYMFSHYTSELSTMFDTAMKEYSNLVSLEKSISSSQA